ncbi:MAG: hypothetical protein Mars2KO_05350 [Maribacter sp.]
MQNKLLPSNAQNLEHALGFLQKAIDFQLRHYYDNGKALLESYDTDDLEYYDDDSAFAQFIKTHTPNFAEFITLLLALAPHLQPDFLEKCIKKAIPDSGDYTEIGGQRDSEGRGFLPTGETALFLLAGDHLNFRFAVQQLFSADHWFAREEILTLEKPKEGDPFFNGKIIMNPDYIELFTTGKISNPEFGPSFPAQHITTKMDWSDLVLSPLVNEQIHELKNWVEHGQTLMEGWKMDKKIKPGYRVLFCGPPGTGKTLTATLLGKHTGKMVYRVDLSTVVSKYIGETEKNLEKLFSKAASKDWILFFDEADALFGKRTSVNDAHDRYANQEVSYLLQRVENFDGLVILSSNYKANMDEAFLRRFNAIIRFPFPTFEERLEIWKRSFPQVTTFKGNIDIPEIAAYYELSGGSIINVVQYACLKTLSSHETEISLESILKGIEREVEKDGKIFKKLIA